MFRYVRRSHGLKKAVWFTICLGIIALLLNLIDTRNLKTIENDRKSISGIFPIAFIERTSLVSRSNNSNITLQHINTNNKIPRIDVNGTDCKKLSNGAKEEIFKVEMRQKYAPKDAQDPVYYLNQAWDCKKYIEKRNFITFISSREEEEFPIAFSISFFGNFEQAERLLRAIYRPQNVYCFHILSSSLTEIETFTAIAECFDNVIMSSKENSPFLYQTRALESELACMGDLLAYSRKWRYLITLGAQEFPLKTNLEIVKILKAYNGANDIEKYPFNRNLRERTEYEWIYYRKTNKKKAPFENGIQIHYGSKKIAATREFVHFAVKSDVSKQFLKWLGNTKLPEESFFSSLNYSPDLQIPGSFTGYVDETKGQKTMTHYMMSSRDGYCYFQNANSSCDFRMPTFSKLASSPELFSPRIPWTKGFLALDCLEYNYYKRVEREMLLGNTDLDISFYDNLEFVKHHLLPERIF